MSDITLDKIIDINYTNYIGHINNIYHINRYFSYKYDNIHVLDYSILCEYNNPELPIYISKISEKYEYPQYINGEEFIVFKNNLQKLMSDDDIRFIFISFLLISIDYSLGNHANSLIYDKNEKSFELFEPLGQTKKQHFYDIYNKLELMLKEHFSFEIFYKPLDFCPKRSFQSYDKGEYPNFKGGFCMAWSLWYVDMRLNNENVPREKVIRKALLKLYNDNKIFTQFIGNYSSFIYFIKNNMINCNINNNCITENLFFSIIIQFYDLIDFDVLLFNICSPKIKQILKKIINNCGYSHLQKLCETIHNDKCIFNFYNYSIRKALKFIVNKYDNITNCNLYKSFINAYFDNNHSSYYLKEIKYIEHTKSFIILPYNLIIIDILLNNLNEYEAISKPDRDIKCATLYKIFSEDITHNKDSSLDIIKQYGYMLLLLDNNALINYINSLNINIPYDNNINYFFKLQNLIEQFKSNPAKITELNNLKKIILLNNYKLFINKTLNEINN